MLTPARLVAVSLVAALTCAALSGCARNGAPRDFAGEVVDDTVTLQAPALPMPSVDLDAGFAPSTASDRSTGARRSAVATPAALTGLGTVARVASVSVTAGVGVHEGQEIARLDSAALDANVAIAKSTVASARAQVGVLDDALDTVASNRSTLASKRAQINDAATLLTTTRAQACRAAHRRQGPAREDRSRGRRAEAGPPARYRRAVRSPTPRNCAPESRNSRRRSRRSTPASLK